MEVKDKAVTLEWECPESDGNSPIKRYIIEKKSSNGSFKLAEKVDGNTFRVKVNDLKENKKYFFRVYAENEIGKSEKVAEITDGVVTKAGESEFCTCIHLEFIIHCSLYTFFCKYVSSLRKTRNARKKTRKR